jgi:cell division protein DivIC
MKSKIKELLLGKYRFYTLTFSGLLIWMTFFDANDFYTQWRLRRELSRLEGQKEYYHKKLKDLEKEKVEVMGNPKLVEKFAREKYLMKREKEEIFVLVDPDNQPIEK